MIQNKEIGLKVERYYSDKINRYGVEPKGVDWKDVESQNLRFFQLMRIMEADIEESKTLLDLGCGYGALLDFLKSQNLDCDYLGVDLSEEMISGCH